MPVVDVSACHKKEKVMQDTWGHMFPKPSTKYKGFVTFVEGEYGDCVIIQSEFPGLDCSPHRHSLEHTVFDMYGGSLEIGHVYRLDCSLWFYKDINHGRIIKPKLTLLLGDQNA